MRYFIHTLTFAILCLAMNSGLFAQGLQVFIANKLFYVPENGPYIESQIMIPGAALQSDTLSDGTLQAEVEVTLIFKQSGEIKAFDKYVLSGKTGEVGEPGYLMLIDQKRFSLPNGTYTLDATFIDMHEKGNRYVFSEPIIVDFKYDEVFLSDITLVDSYSESTTQTIFSKSGKEIVPYVLNFYPTELEKLVFYIEVYNTYDLLKGDDFLFSYNLRKAGTDKIVSGFSRYQKTESQEVNVFLSQFDISSLPSGNYDLVVEVKDRLNNLLGIRKLFIQRSNQGVVTTFQDLEMITISNSFVADLTKEEVEYYIRSLRPIATPDEWNYLKTSIQEEDEELMEKAFLNFWLTKDPLQPDIAWMNYLKKVNMVNNSFSTLIDEGFDTDRGRVYLQYGPPVEILGRDMEPGAKPYEIWHYYQLSDNQKSAKFVFYNPTLENNNFQLIHSTARGEINDYRWKSKVFDTFTGNGAGNFDDTEIRDHFGSDVDRNWNEP